MNHCPLCEIPEKEQYRVVRNNDLVYAAIPYAPITEGHVMVLPKRHTRLRQLIPEELVSLNETIEDLKDRLVELFPERHPFISTMSDTKHASVPQHGHYHLLPSKYNLRVLYDCRDQRILSNEPVERSILEEMALRLR